MTGAGATATGVSLAAFGVALVTDFLAEALAADLVGVLAVAFAGVLAAGFLAAALPVDFLAAAAPLGSAFFLDAFDSFAASAFVFSLCVRLAPA